MSKDLILITLNLFPSLMIFLFKLSLFFQLLEDQNERYILEISTVNRNRLI